MLKLLIHFDAFRASPLAYVEALWWWLRRKRVRARAKFAPLLALSPRAYSLWLAKEDVVPNVAAMGEAPLILILVDVAARPDARDETLRRLEHEGLVARAIDISEPASLERLREQIDWTKEVWLMPISAGDAIAPDAVGTYQAAISQAGTASLIYADDDLLDNAGRRSAAHFKPDWNAELFSYFDYLSGACALRAKSMDLEELAMCENWFEQLVARAARRGEPVHIPRVLHHRVSRPLPRLPVRPIELADPLPPLTIIVPTRDKVQLLRTCLNGIAVTDYPDLDVIVVDNDSSDPETLDFLAEIASARCHVLRHGGAFNYSAINNRAVEVARGQLICLLNNDIEMLDTNWLRIMASQALRDDVGAVGARLLYPDGRIQHAGVVLGMGDAAGHAHRLLDREEEGYFHRHALPQFASAVTAACMVVQRDRFLAVGGFDEHDFPVAFNDVDLCMRLNRRGWQSLYEPRATLIHHESVSRGLDRDPVGAARFARELAALKRSWGTDVVVDPFHHPALSRASERFVLKL